jgi:phosphatidylserine decarboxylase
MQDPIVALQRLLPQPWLARTFGRLARSERRWLCDLLIRLWMRAFDVSLADAARCSPGDYASFEDFFTRELRPDARPQPADQHALVSPADGYLHEFGNIGDGRLVQAKGIDYTLGALLGDEGKAKPFRGGWYATIYLSPADYHRVHAPCDAVLQTAIAIPGQAYSVTARTERNLPDLFCRNERLACLLETTVGPMALVMVGAMLVTGIETVWRQRKPIESFEITRHSHEFGRGEEFGRFTLGSTLIMVLPAQVLIPEQCLARNQRVRVGQRLGLLSAS